MTVYCQECAHTPQTVQLVEYETLRQLNSHYVLISVHDTMSQSVTLTHVRQQQATSYAGESVSQTVRQQAQQSVS